MANARKSFVYESSAMRQAMAEVELFAPHDTSIMITGETGTGKEGVARAIHGKSKRREKPFIAINCAAISPTLIESELFGHEKGSFTGANGQRIGVFEQAKDGTLFLDEIGEMPSELQVKLLRVLQEGTFRRVGGNEDIVAKPRIVAATSQSAQRAIEEGKLRPDLYFRLKGLEVSLPPLRERGEDIGLLAKHFAEQFSSVEKLEPPPHFSDEALSALQQHSWPGNVRELESAVQAACIRAHARGGEITPDMLHLSAPSSTQTTGFPVYPAEMLEKFPALDHKWLNQQLLTPEMKVAEFLKAHRDRLGLNNAEFAEKLGIKRQTVTRLLEPSGRTNVDRPIPLEHYAVSLIKGLELRADEALWLCKVMGDSCTKNRNVTVQSTQLGAVVTDDRTLLAGASQVGTETGAGGVEK